ncbi:MULTISPECIES: VanZ family protein [unclassified Microbacterium]|uniref:VanZ family protein n=1 Tax=unclassified Microbacterium TaxID=2609290 RepID=UPI001E539AAA|nr:VanZ family protein [Microbacterium sp. Au-Mic1]MCE4027315.1 VanZ family protein [Microbacterium sp. Au-Mic1]
MSDSPPTAAPFWHRLTTWALIYGAVVAIIVFSPYPFLSVFDPLIQRIGAVVPGLTLVRAEFIANIAMFVPFGIFLAVFLPRRRYLVLPIGFVTTVTIETVQGLFLMSRSDSVLDILSNTAGAAIGLLIVELVDASRRRSRRFARTDGD